ncbi:hypothetical protein QTP88_022746 [Uroleucon formosanum]
MVTDLIYHIGRSSNSFIELQKINCCRINYYQPQDKYPSRTYKTLVKQSSRFCIKLSQNNFHEFMCEIPSPSSIVPTKNSVLGFEMMRFIQFSNVDRGAGKVARE